jgi:putative ABC transport system permease protein
MLSNYITIIFRKLRKERLYSIINLSGLTIGLTAFLLIALYVRDELSYDKFHTDQEEW